MTHTDWSHIVATVEQDRVGRVAVGAYRAGLLMVTLGAGYPSRARLDALYRAAGERTQSPVTRPEPAAAGIDVTAAAGRTYVRISRAGWAPRSRWRAVWDFATTLPFIVGPSCALWLAIVVYQGRELVYIP